MGMDARLTAEWEIEEKKSGTTAKVEVKGPAWVLATVDGVLAALAEDLRKRAKAKIRATVQFDQAQLPKAGG